MAAASGIASELLEFLNAAPTPFHAVGMLGYILLFFTISILFSRLSPTKLRTGFWGRLGFGFGKSDFFGFYFARVFSRFGYEGRMTKVFLCFRGGAGCGWALLLLCCNRGSQTEVERSRFCTNLRKTSMECRSWREILLHTQPFHHHSICNWQQVCKQSLSFSLLSCNLTYTHTFSCKAS